MHPGAQSAPIPGNPGEVLLGKYRVEEVIGVGGMGRVVRATHLYLQQPVAIKILLPGMAESQSTVQRFLREAQATVKLRSEHIARVMDVGTLADGTPFMVMEFLEGHDLNQILRHHGPQLAQAVVDMMLQACEGISEAHAMGIIHRDIKPSNFFITRRPDGSNLLKILDFGISKLGGEISELTGTQTVIGTPTYMAPEQMQTARSTDPRSDIWSIGVVMYQMLAGRPPFEAEHYAQLVLKVANEPPAPLSVPLPPGLQSIVFRCLEKKPQDRIQSVGELARMLAPYSSDPLSAQQSAERATRILNARQSGMAMGAQSLGAGGGMPLTPPALTPKSWNHTNGSSLSAGAGQVGTRVVRNGRRGLVIGGVAALCIAAGGGGFLIANGMKGSGSGSASETHVSAPATNSTDITPPPTPTPAMPPAPPPAPTPTPTPTKTDPPKVDTKTATKTDATKTTKTDTPKVDTKTTTAAKTDTTKSSHTESTKTSHTESTKSSSTKTTKTTKTTSSKSKDDDLFDDRH